MSNDLVVRGGTIITAADRFVADVGIRAGRIVEIGESLPRASQEIDAAGLQVLPGGVDVHTHLDVDVGTVHTADDFESGTAAAACGGITTICDYAWQRRGQTIGEAIRTWQAKACDKAHIDYGFHVILSEVSDAHLAEIPSIVAAGYPSFKVFMINEFGIGDHAFLRLLGAARTAGALVNVHAENGDMIDHVAREMVVAGRHDPRYYAESRPALETEMQVIYSEGVSKGRMSVHTFVGAFATNPARIFGLYPKKGTIAVGSDADLVLFDPARTRVLDEQRLHSRAGYDPFHGLEVRGVPVLTLSRGEIVA